MENNIEEDIKILEKFKSIKILYGKTFVMHIEQLEKIQNALSNILNLIKGKTIHLSDEEYRKVIENAKKDIKQKYEDKIKNKIEEVEDVLDMCKADGNVARYKMQQLEEEIENLEELLEDK